MVQDIVESGKRLFCYFEGNEITLDGATDKIMMALRVFAAESTGSTSRPAQPGLANCSRSEQ